MHKSPKLQRAALIRIHALAKQAEREFFAGHPELADRYVHLSRKIAMKVRISLPLEFRRNICKSCKSYLVASKNCTVRLSKGKIVTHCHKCKSISRYVYRKPRKKVSKALK